MNYCPLSYHVRWRLMVGVTAALAGSLLAGCCGGPLGAEEGCGTSCNELRAATEPGCIPKDASTDATRDAGTDAARDAGADATGD